jgi:hypothetical protein
MLEKIDSLQHRVGQSMIDDAPLGWERLNLTATAAGGSIEVSGTVISRQRTLPFLPSVNADAALIQLRQTMFRPGHGTWYLAHFSLALDGELEVDYDYNSIPLDEVHRTGVDDDLREILVEDQELFPRDQENLPGWHPCRDSGSDVQPPA